MDVSHPEIEEFINMRKTTGGDLNRKCLNLHNAVTVNDKFLKAVQDNTEWRLIDPKSNEAIKIMSARDIWFQIINTRAETGEPYIVNLDRCNEELPQHQKDIGLKVTQSNLCSEITLPTNEERTAVCCLSSVNLEYFDDWKDSEEFIDDMITMLDNVLEHFIEHSTDTQNMGKYNATYDRFKNYVKEDHKGFTKAAYSAYRERAIGLGAMGFCSYLQRNAINFESMYATSFNHLLAIAPNASSSIICGGTSPSVEPQRANTFTHKTLTGSYKVKNKYLEALLKKKGINNEETWKDIAAHEGSVQHLDELSEEEKEIFRTAPELNQLWIIEHAHQRQQYICQSQSINLFFTFPKATEPQDVHNSYLEYVNSVHWAGANKLKSLYYLRSDAARAAENVNIKIPKINLEDMECLSCEG